MKKIFLLIFLIVALIGLAGCYQAETNTSDGQLGLKKIGQFDNPVYMTEAGGNTYLVEQTGKVLVKSPGQGWQTFLDVTGKTTFSGEQGLLSIAFSPNWDRDKLFYVYYTNKDEKQVIAEGATNKDGTSGSLKREVLVMDDFAGNHNGGLMIFGPGGLYIGTGDGGGSGDPERTALDTYSLLGKILRISPYQKDGKPYTIPTDNPFVSGGGAKEVYSYGLRNPWRFSIADDRIWIADVGQNDLEEINAPTLAEANGASFGWSALEGTRPFNDDQKSPDSIKPVLEYKHKDNRCSVTGGYVVKDKSLPQLLNRYIYSDYCQGIIRSFKLVDGRATNDKAIGLSLPSLASFAEGSQGQVWAISKTGSVYQLIQK